MSTTQEVLDDIDGVIEWHGSVDSAQWSADGSHEVDTNGYYYATDTRLGWHEQNFDYMLRRNLRPLIPAPVVQRLLEYVYGQASLALSQYSAASPTWSIQRDGGIIQTVVIDEAAGRHDVLEEVTQGARIDGVWRGLFDQKRVAERPPVPLSAERPFQRQSWDRRPYVRFI